MLISNHSVLRTSGQLWKYVVWLVAFLVSSVTVLVSSRTGHIDLAFGSMLAGLAALFFGWRMVRCQQCGARWLWMAMSEQGAMGWSRWLSEQKACPRCGYDPRVAKQ
jgi:hypothetical protein